MIHDALERALNDLNDYEYSRRVNGPLDAGGDVWWVPLTSPDHKEALDALYEGIDDFVEAKLNHFFSEEYDER